MKEITTFKATTGLQKAVKELLLRNIEEGKDEEFMNDLMESGCIGGMVSGLTFFSETQEFFNNNKEEINELLSNMIADIGVHSPKDLFGNKFDEEDFLCLEVNNQNLLAWFAFEETARMIAESLGMEF